MYRRCLKADTMLTVGGRILQQIRGSRTLLQIVVSRKESRSTSSAFNQIYPRHDDFSERHIGPSTAEKEAMLEVLNMRVGCQL